MSQRLALLLLCLMAAVLVANALVGERGFVQTVKVRGERRELADSIARLQRENRRLAAEAERLRHDPTAIEELARGDLGLIRPGERLFIVVDRSAPRRARLPAID